MIGLRFVALSLVVPAAGYWLRATSARRLPVAARVAFYAAAGLLTLSTVMFGMSLLGWEWTVRRILVLPLMASAATAVLAGREDSPKDQSRGTARLRAAEGGVLALALLAIGGVVPTIALGAAPPFDLVFFWGAEGEP